jgi:hypothetical protein
MREWQFRAPPPATPTLQRTISQSLYPTTPQAPKPLTKKKTVFDDLFAIELTEETHEEETIIIETSAPSSIIRRLIGRGKETSYDRALNVHKLIVDGLTLSRQEPIAINAHPHKNLVFRQTGALCQMYATFQILYTALFAEMSEWTQNVLICLLQQRYQDKRFETHFNTVEAQPNIMKTYKTKRESDEDSPAHGSFKDFLYAMLVNELKDKTDVRIVQGKPRSVESGYTICCIELPPKLHGAASWKAAYAKQDLIPDGATMKAMCVLIGSNKARRFAYPHFVTCIHDQWYDNSEHSEHDTPQEDYTLLRHFTMKGADVTHVYLLLYKA